MTLNEMPMDGDQHANAQAVARLVRGDAAAFGELYQRLGPQARRIALRVVHDTDEAQDVVHDAFVEAWRRAPEYAAGRGTVAAWILMIVKSRAIDRVRRRRSRFELLQLVTDDLQPVPTAGPEAVSEIRALESCVSELPRCEQAVVDLAIGQGYTSVEVSEKLGLPIGTVKSRVARALRALRAD